MFVSSDSSRVSPNIKSRSFVVCVGSAFNPKYVPFSGFSAVKNSSGFIPVVKTFRIVENVLVANPWMGFCFALRFIGSGLGSAVSRIVSSACLAFCRSCFLFSSASVSSILFILGMWPIVHQTDFNLVKHWL